MFIYFLFGLSNGIIFGPPSEYVIWAAVKENGLGLEFHIFIIANILGHVILFELAKGHYKTIEKFVLRIPLPLKFKKQFIRSSRRSIAFFHEPSGLYVLYGRCLPFFHTFVSIVAAHKGLSRLRFIGLTISGDYVFGLLIYVHYTIFSQLFGQALYLAFLFLTATAVHFVLKRRIRQVD